MEWVPLSEQRPWRAHLHETVDLLRVAGARRLADPLGQAAVQRRLASLKARPRAGASPRLLAAVSKAARHTLPGGHAPSLPLLLLVRPGRRLQRAKRDRLQLRGGRVPDLPVEDLHVHRGARGARGYTPRGSQTTAEQTLHGQEPCQHEQHGCRDGLSGDPEDSHLAGETLAGRGDNPRMPKMFAW